ncbi:DUF4184 family protein [Streptomyces sp. NPDC001250]|uniref:DUF4184 family protein n=1 Tax=Streptomyces sp. NPDC001250 TaxID=3154382 RepID=UPI0033324F49
MRSRIRSPGSSRSTCSSPGRWRARGCSSAHRCSRCCPGTCGGGAPVRAAAPRCPPRAGIRVGSVVWWYVSAALGALTHVVRDAFTHDGRWGTRLIPAIEHERDHLAGRRCSRGCGTARPWGARS